VAVVAVLVQQAAQAALVDLERGALLVLLPAQHIQLQLVLVEGVRLLLPPKVARE
jgi:hypothetical protein